MICFAMKPLLPARLRFSEQGTPFSPDYDDVYHAAQGAFAQARHVFLQGNGLPERWQGASQFTICETGFGLGTNFLTAWEAWKHDPQRSARLHFLSLEAHPFPVDDLRQWWSTRAPAAWQTAVQSLLRQWPLLTPGLHRLEFEGGRVTLTLAFGPARDLAPKLRAQVDAFFLDGFAPAKNPEMWSVELFKALSYLARRGATAATWCAAGAVRRALQQVGFEVERRPGFAGKQHMTVARYAPAFTPRHALQERQTVSARRCVVVGSGIAGAGLAHALRQRGWSVTVVSASGLATRTDGHLAAAITPLIARDDNIRARLSRAAVLRARARWAAWLGSPALLPCGTLHLARDEAQAERFADTVQALQFPASWLQYLNAEAASQQAGVRVARSAWWLPQAMRIQPGVMIPALLEGVECRQATVSRLHPTQDGWRVDDVHGQCLAEAPVVVLANGGEALQLLTRTGLSAGLDAPQFLSSKQVAGQINVFPTEQSIDVQCVVAGDGYVLPSLAGLTVVGGTYVHDLSVPVPNAAGEAVNRAHLQALLPAADVNEALPGGLSGQAWAGHRHVLPGRLPVVAEHPAAPGLWVCAGYASRGMSWAALAGDILAAELDVEPQVVETDLLHALNWR